MRGVGRALLGAAVGLALALSLGSPGTAATGKRVALVIGNSAYTHVRTLGSPINDAAKWAEKLKGAGFEVDQCLDCKLSAMKDKLGTFGEKISAGDEAFFYYSGHGAEQNDLNLLFPVDAEVWSCGTMLEQSVSLGLVLDAMEKARVKVVVLDACRSSPFPTCTKDLDQRLYGPPKVAPDGTFIAYATTRGDPATDDGMGSAYSKALLPLAFQPGKSLFQAISDAAPVVKQTTDGRQVPWVYTSISGDPYVLVPAISPAVTADAEWTKIAAMPEGSAKTSAVVSFLGQHGTSGASSVAAAKSYLTSLGGSGRSASLPLGKLGDPPAGGPTGRTTVARKGTAGEMTFIELSEGVFDMGSPAGIGSDDERPQRRIRVSAFAMGRSEVTQAQWAAVVKAAQAKKDPDAKSLNIKPSYFSGDTLPVEQVSWCDAARFANALSRLEGLTPAYTVGEDCKAGGEVAWDHTATGYRLPTEAEWEYAARAGTSTVYATGDTEADLARAGWYRGNSGSKTHPVCTAEAKPWGLCDLHGNVWEWAWDWYGPYQNAEVGNLQGAPRGVDRVLRGGSWYFSPVVARSAFRVGDQPSLSLRNLGFRLVRPVVPPER